MVRLENNLKTSLQYSLKMSWRRLKMFWRRLEDVLKSLLQKVLKTSWRVIMKTTWKCLENVLKTYDQDEYIGLNQSVLKISWWLLLKMFSENVWVRRIIHLDQDVLKTSSEDEDERCLDQDKCLLDILKKECN